MGEGETAKYWGRGAVQHGVYILYILYIYIERFLFQRAECIINFDLYKIAL